MYVFVVEQQAMYSDESTILGAFTTMEKAKEFVDESMDLFADSGDYGYYIHRLMVNRPFEG